MWLYKTGDLLKEIQKNNKYNTIKTVPKSNWKNRINRSKIDTRPLSWLGGVKLVLWVVHVLWFQTLIICLTHTDHVYRTFNIFQVYQYFTIHSRYFFLNLPLLECVVYLQQQLLYCLPSIFSGEKIKEMNHYTHAF
jgi:hypothetical protein